MPTAIPLAEVYPARRSTGFRPRGCFPFIGLHSVQANVERFCVLTMRAKRTIENRGLFRAHVLSDKLQWLFDREKSHCHFLSLPEIEATVPA